MPKPGPCPRCQGSMSQGWTIDNTHGGRGVSAWVEGEPRRSFWVGVSLRGKTPVEIQTWRCGRCGYLENYAPR